MANALESAYERAFGSAASKGQLYTGFFLLLAGVALAVAGIVVFQTSVTDYGWREAAIVLASLSAPSIFLGIFWALPSKVAMRTIAVIGTGLCLIGTVLFSRFYPLQFNAPGNENLGFPDRTGLVIGVYAVGLVMLLAGTFTSLIGYYLSRITAGATGAGRAAGTGVEFDPNAAYQYDIPDSVIERDIELAMKRYKYSWGGEGGSGAASQGLQINVPDEFEPGVKIGGKGIARTVSLETPQVDDATKKLRGMRPQTDRSMSGAWADESTKKLLEFRKKKEALVEQRQAAQVAAAQSRRRSWWVRFLEFLGLRKPEPSPQKDK